LIKQIAWHVQGNPLALKVLGSSLYGKSIEEWRKHFFIFFFLLRASTWMEDLTLFPAKLQNNNNNNKPFVVNENL